MDELNNNPFDPYEIDRIQAQIDKDLLRINTEAGVAGEYAENMPDITDTSSTSTSGIRETVSESIITQDCGDNRAVSTLTENNSFFKETVKAESEKHSKGKFKRFIAALCIVSILGGISAGIAIPIASEFIIPKLKAGESGNVVTDGLLPDPKFTFLRDGDGVAASSTEQPLTGVLSFADLIDAVEPSVVCITVTKTSTSTGNIFGIPMEEEVPSGGSGIIFDKDEEKLYIVTNEHVISGATGVAVSVRGGEDVPASLVGKDTDSDLAVISINIKDLQKIGINDFVIASFANSQEMRVGDFVIAVGNALGKGNTATFGFVSAIDKEIYVGGKPFKVIQTDAAINPGNSGGPLINLKGEVIGINMVKFVEARVEGTGYALTSDVAMPIIEQIRNRTARPLLGIQGFNMTETVANAFSLPMMGIIVESVVPDSGADKAGIKVSDIITSFNGQTVLNMSQLTEEVQKCSIGDKVEVKLIRDGKDTITLNVTLLEDNSASF